MFTDQTREQLAAKIKAANPAAKETELYTRFVEGPARAAFREVFEQARGIAPQPPETAVSRKEAQAAQKDLL